MLSLDISRENNRPKRKSRYDAYISNRLSSQYFNNSDNFYSLWATSPKHPREYTNPNWIFTQK